MIEHFGSIVGTAGTITGIITTVFYFRRARKAEIGSQEAATADKMVELVEKAFNRVFELQQIETKKLRETLTMINQDNETLRDNLEQNNKENEKLRKIVGKLEWAVRSVFNCPYRDNCPISVELQSDTAISGEQGTDPN